MLNGYNGYPQQMFSNGYQTVAQMQSQQIQNGGFVSVRNETEARNYPVALGNSVTFKDETAPYIYTKTMGFSQLDIPRFEKYKLVKETPVEQTELPQEESNDKSVFNTIDEMKNEIKQIWNEIEGIKNVKPDPTSKRSVKKEKDGDD